MIWNPRRNPQAAPGAEADRGALLLTVLAAVLVLCAWLLNRGAVEPTARGNPLPTAIAR